MNVQKFSTLRVNHKILCLLHYRGSYSTSSNVLNTSKMIALFVSGGYGAKSSRGCKYTAQITVIGEIVKKKKK